MRKYLNNHQMRTVIMYRFCIMFTVVLGTCLISQWSWAEQAYVTDNLKITFRSGPGTQHRIISMLSSGQPVDVLDSQQEWSFIRLPGSAENTAEGWVLSQYLILRPPWEMQAAALSQQNTRLKEQVQALQANLRETQRLKEQLEAKLGETSDTLGKLDKEYQELREGSAEYLKLKQTLETARSKMNRVENDFEKLNEEYKKRKYSERNVWSATGAGILVFGLLIGIVMGRREKKRKQRLY